MPAECVQTLVQHHTLPRLELVEADAALKVLHVGDQIKVVQPLVVSLRKRKNSIISSVWRDTVFELTFISVPGRRTITVSVAAAGGGAAAAAGAVGTSAAEAGVTAAGVAPDTNAVAAVVSDFRFRPSVFRSEPSG